jgi:methyl-accepting chemotaxis protein
MADMSQIIDRIRQIEAKREVLVALLDQPELGTLRIDVNQAIEELDDLVAEFQRTFGK